MKRSITILLFILTVNLYSEDTENKITFNNYIEPTNEMYVFAVGFKGDNFKDNFYGGIKLSFTNFSLNNSKPNLWTSISCQINDKNEYKVSLGQELQLTYLAVNSFNYTNFMAEMITWLLTPNICYQVDNTYGNWGLSYELAFTTLPGLKPYMGQRISLNDNSIDFYYGISFSIIVNKDFWK